FRAVLDPDFARNLASYPDDAIAQGVRVTTRDELRARFARYPAQVKQLTEDADAFYTASPARPSRTDVPVLAADASPAGALVTLFQHKQRLIIGAANACVASKQ
ncbi:hypothetical protein, partial [Staphylococcus aureus]